MIDLLSLVLEEFSKKNGLDRLLATPTLENFDTVFELIVSQLISEAQEPKQTKVCSHSSPHLESC